MSRNTLVYVAVGVAAVVVLAVGGYFFYQKYTVNTSPTVSSTSEPELDTTQVDTSLSQVDDAENDVNQAVNDQPDNLLVE